jgi:hypothetical protein
MVPPLAANTLPASDKLSPKAKIASMVPALAPGRRPSARAAIAMGFEQEGISLFYFVPRFNRTAEKPSASRGSVNSHAAFGFPVASRAS